MDVPDTFYSFCSGRGRESPRRRDGRGEFLIENPRRGGLQEGGRVEGPGGCLRRIGELGVGGGG